MPDILLTWIAAVAAGFLAWRAFIRLHAMCWQSPHLLRLSAFTMAVSALAIVFGALYADVDYVEWGKTFALASVAMHIISDRRTVTERLGQSPANDRRVGCRRTA